MIASSLVWVMLIAHGGGLAPVGTFSTEAACIAAALQVKAVKYGRGPQGDDKPESAICAPVEKTLPR